MSRQLKYMILLSTFFTFLSPAIAGSLVAPELSNAVSYWRSFNNKKFQLCKIKNNKRKPKKVVKKLKVFFDNDSSELAEDQERNILKGFEKYFTKNVSKIEIVGHADILGSDDYNLRLSHARLTSVIDFINYHRRSLITHSINVMTDYKGERKSTAHQRRDRFVEIRFIQIRPVTDNIKRIYLVDGSLSMKSRRTVSGFTFDDLRRMRIPRDTLVYVVRDNYVGCAGKKISDYRPKGRTFIREAMAIFAHNMRGKIKFTTFTDAVEPLTAQEENYIESFITQSKEKYGIKWYVK